jgi:dedicator of cytokinesis protein 3
MQNKHPGATLLKTSAAPSEEIQFSDGQFLQITSVSPEPDKTTAIFTNPNVPKAVRAYYQNSGTK